MDVETTGLSPKAEEIIEIAAIKVDGKTLKIKSSMEFLVDSGKWIPPFIIKLTGITNTMIEEAGIPLKVALNLLSDFAGDLNSSSEMKLHLATVLIKKVLSKLEN